MAVSPYWQHREPLQCPKQHVMVWLGSVYWICGRCRVIYVQIAVLLVVIALSATSCATGVLCGPRRWCPDGQPVQVIQDPRCLRGICGYTCAPDRWRAVDEEQ